MGGISSSITKEDLEEEFLKFGKIEDFKFLRDRNTAFIEFFRIEDASQAMRSMNGKRLGGDQIRVDFLRSQPSRRVSCCIELRVCHMRCMCTVWDSLHLLASCMLIVKLDN